MMHLGTRVAALVDGQLSSAEEERAWSHVHSCPTCRSAVEREGWVKRQLACLSFVNSSAPSAALKGSLSRPAFASYPETMPELAEGQHRSRRFAGLAALGAGSAGAAMFGVLALGSAPPAESPVMERRAPATTSLMGANPATGVPVRNRNRDDEVDAIKRVMTAWVRMGL